MTNINYNDLMNVDAFLGRLQEVMNNNYDTCEYWQCAHMIRDIKLAMDNIQREAKSISKMMDYATQNLL